MCGCMTMFSFRVDSDEAEETARWPSDQALTDPNSCAKPFIDIWLDYGQTRSGGMVDEALTSEETSLADVADWGPAEDWSDWLDETR